MEKKLRRTLLMEQLKRDITVQQMLNSLTGADQVTAEEIDGYAEDNGEVVRTSKYIRLRNKFIKDRYKRGESYKDIAHSYALSEGRIKQIVERGQ